jgi:Primase C terminal 2 (PriCT-2)/Family of unknown function (DUF5906)
MTFFERVLPATGPFTLFTGATGPDGKLIEQRHWNGLKTHADVEREVQRLSMLPLNIFFATGSYAGINRKDPIAKRAFHLDLDGKDFPGGTAQAVQELGTFVKATGLPPPSIYVTSGRGVHVYWCLDSDVPVDQWKPVSLALKAKCEELGFKADPTSTADPARVLRAPGSLNRKGEMPIPCNVMLDNGNTYAVGDIAKQLQLSPGLVGAAAKLKALASNDDLVAKRDHEQKTPDQVREMLTHINLPQFASRDMWITVLCGVQDWSAKSAEGFDIFDEWSSEQPGYVSTEDCWVTWQSFDPGGGIGIGTLIKLARDGGWGEPTPVPVVSQDVEAPLAEQMSTPATPAVNIPQAPYVPTQQRVSPLLMAATHAVASTGKHRFDNKEAVMWLSNEFVMILDQEALFFSMTEKMPLSKTIIDDLLTRYMPLNSNGVPTNASALMRRYGLRHTVNSQGFFPGQPVLYTENGKSYVNLYTEPAAMLVPTQQEGDMVADLWNYLFPRPEDQAFGTYLLKFYAHVVQKPAIKITSAPLMISKEFGTGKTTAMFDIPKALVGTDNSKLVSNKVLRSSFSDYITGSQFLHFDEVHINGKWDSDDTANSLKNLVTGTSVEIHPKGLKPYNIPNRIFITATSNYEDAITLPSNDERRWGIYYLEPTRQLTLEERKAYFKTFHDWLNGPRGPGVLRHIFNSIPISDFNPHAPPPITEAKYAMVQRSQQTEVQLIIDAFKHDRGPFYKDLFTTEDVGQWLNSETSRAYPGMIVRGFINKAMPHARILGQVRNGEDRVRPWVHRNHEKWDQALPDDIRAELKR